MTFRKTPPPETVMPELDPGIQNGGPGAKADRTCPRDRPERHRPATDPVSTGNGRAFPATGNAADSAGGKVGEARLQYP